MKIQRSKVSLKHSTKNKVSLNVPYLIISHFFPCPVFFSVKINKAKVGLFQRCFH